MSHFDSRHRQAACQVLAGTLHGHVSSDCRAELHDENCFHAVFEATKGVAERIRTLSGLATAIHSTGFRSADFWNGCVI